MTKRFDVIVAGLGAMGSATAYHLSLRGCRVLGLDRYQPPHAWGSSHGRSRIIREAYFEHPSYVPLVQRAYALWEDLERRSGRTLFRQTGGLMIGGRASQVFMGAKRSAGTHGLTHEILDAAEVRKRAPALQPEDGMMAVWEPRAGFLYPEECIAAHLRLAREAGAALRLGEELLFWEENGQGVRVKTSLGEYEADNLALCAGPWIAPLLADLKLPVKVERQVLFWFEPVGMPEQFGLGCCPVHLWEFDQGRFFYGFPDIGEGVKLAIHHEGEIVNPATVSREVTAGDEERMREVMRRFVPMADGPVKSASVCLYTTTPDGHFLIDVHPAHPRVMLVSPCSGHGFKFASAVGEAVAGRVLGDGRSSSLDLSLFAWRW